jgi:hypothetical protein
VTNKGNYLSITIHQLYIYGGRQFCVAIRGFDFITSAKRGLWQFYYLKFLPCFTTFTSFSIILFKVFVITAEGYLEKNTGFKRY